MFIKRVIIYETKDENHVDEKCIEYVTSDIFVVYCLHFASHYPLFTWLEAIMFILFGYNDIWEL